MSAKYWNLLVPNQLNALPPAEQFAAYALAYLDSAQRLCGILARSPRKATFERGAVVLYLTAHAVELFLKGAIMRKSAGGQPVHDLESLHDRYRKLYPGKRFNFSIPFEPVYPPRTSAAQKRALKELAPPTDQLYRYPRSKKGQPWFGLFGFEAGSFQRELSVMRQEFTRLLDSYDG